MSFLQAKFKTHSSPPTLASRNSPTISPFPTPPPSDSFSSVRRECRRVSSERGLGKIMQSTFPPKMFPHAAIYSLGVLPVLCLKNLTKCCGKSQFRPWRGEAPRCSNRRKIRSATSAVPTACVQENRDETPTPSIWA